MWMERWCPLNGIIDFIDCRTHDSPTTKPATAPKVIGTNHKLNMSGTPKQYILYFTTIKKIQEWVPHNF